MIGWLCRCGTNEGREATSKRDTKHVRCLVMDTSWKFENIILPLESREPRMFLFHCCDEIQRQKLLHGEKDHFGCNHTQEVEREQQVGQAIKPPSPPQRCTSSIKSPTPKGSTAFKLRYQLGTKCFIIWAPRRHFTFKPQQLTYDSLWWDVRYIAGNLATALATIQ